MKLYYAIIILVYKPPLKEARKLTARTFPILPSPPIFLPVLQHLQKKKVR